MRFLADENFDFRVIQALRNAGHDVLAVAEVWRGASDLDVIQHALEELRVILTEDRDFGQLVFAAGRVETTGVLYVRCRESARASLPERIVRLVERLGPELERCFVVSTPGRIRVHHRALER